MLNIFALPVIVALLIKLTLLVFAKRRGTKSEYLFGLIVAFVFQNIAELSLFLEIGMDMTGHTLMRTYYVCATVTSVFCCYYAFEIGRPGKSNKVLHVTFLPLSAVLIVATLSSNMIVSGAESIGYALTAIKGAQYWYFQAVMILVLCFVSYMLITGYKAQRNQENQVKCAYSLFAFLPVILTVFGILIFMAMGYRINNMVVYPLATTAFIFILVLSEGRHRISDIRQYIPLSLENQLAANTRDFVSQYSQEKISHKQLISELNKLSVEYKLTKLNGNVLQVSESMQEPRSSVYWLVKEHGLDLKDYRKPNSKNLLLFTSSLFDSISSKLGSSITSQGK